MLIIKINTYMKINVEKTFKELTDYHELPKMSIQTDTENPIWCQPFQLSEMKMTALENQCQE